MSESPSHPFLPSFFSSLAPRIAPQRNTLTDDNRAFTQLLADRQFAQLGLMLIGVLAQVEAAVAPFVRLAEPDGDDDDNKVGPDGAQPVGAGIAAGRGGGGGPVAPQVGAAGEDNDLGVAISRDEVDDDEEDGVEDVASGPRRSSPPPPKQAPVKEKRPEKGESKGKKRSRAEDAGPSRVGKPEKPTRPESSKDEKKVKKKKKKKKKGGDEFDDLFSSLM